MPHATPRSTDDDGPHPVDVHVGRRIVEARKALEYTQTDVAREIGVTFQQLQKYERGYNRVSASRLHHIAGFLHKPIGWFFPIDAEAPVAEGPPTSREAIEISRLAADLSPRDQKTVLALMRSLVGRSQA